ncbi:MAG TPA: response regulator, partial [Minicystis sp.]|nr:response regulator [Minicystis sp.]
MADSHPVTAGALSWLLREHGYSVATVGGRDELFANITRATPDVILLDGEVAREDVDILHRVRAGEQWRDVRVIVTAPWASLDDGAAAMPWGADDCVSVPFRVPELLSRIRTQLRASGQLRAARAALDDTAAELQRVREDALSNRRLVDILHEVTGELSATEIYRLLAVRVARALEISHCSVVLARPGDAVGSVVAAAEDATVQELEISLSSYPEIRTALESERPVLVTDAATHPLFAATREELAREGKQIDIRSVATIPFTIDRWRAGVLFLRTVRGERPLVTDDVEFADIVIRAAVAAIRRAQALETTRADN